MLTRNEIRRPWLRRPRQGSQLGLGWAVVLLFGFLGAGVTLPREALASAMGMADEATDSALARWVRIGPENAPVTRVVVGSGGGPDWLVVAGRQGPGLPPPVYRSDDGGLTWRAAAGEGDGAIPPGRVSDLAVDPFDSERVWAVVVEPGSAVVTSEDGGASWRTVPSDAGAYRLLVDPVGAVYVYGGPLSRFDSASGRFRVVFESTAIAAVGADGSLWAVPWSSADSLYRSTDGGSSWRRTSPTGSYCGSSCSSWLSPDPTRPERLWTEGRGGLARSDDYGAHFVPIGPTNERGDPLVAGPLVIHPERGDELWGYRSAFDPRRGWLRSLDGGVTWRAWARSLPLAVWVGPGELAVDPREPQRALVGSWQLGAAGVQVTTDDGASFTEGRGLEAAVDDVAVEASGSDHRWAVVGATLFERPGEGQAWRRAGIHTGRRVEVYRVVADGQRRGVVWARTSAGLLRTEDGGRSWQRLSARQRPDGLAVDPGRAGTVYGLRSGRLDGLLVRSSDGGATFRDTNLHLENLMRMVTAPTDRFRLALLGAQCTGHNRFGDCETSRSIGATSNDGGRSWRYAKPPGVVRAVAFAPTPPHALLVATESGLFERSADRAPWRRLDSHRYRDLAAGRHGLYALRAVADGSVVVASGDGGASWRRLGEPLPYPATALTVVASPGPDSLLVSTVGGLYQLTR